jgi:hypothetical protein
MAILAVRRHSRFQPTDGFLLPAMVVVKFKSGIMWVGEGLPFYAVMM